MYNMIFWTCLVGHVYTSSACTCWKCNVSDWHVTQHTTTHCSTLQHTAANSNTLQHASYLTTQHILGRNCLFRKSLPRKCYNDTHCNTLQHTATHCNAHYHILAVSLISNESCIHSEKHWYSKKNTKKSLVCTHERPVEYVSFVDR